ncbi:acetyltransferase [beta proteobacterium AAP121]|nr:acetyltransferase [beta proteobacterium AAP65]KPF99219.1 acetyltransferase [beta proteobacterium AAP121]
MSAVPTLSTPRLRLRGFTAHDLDTWAGVCADAEVMQHIGAGGPVGRDAAWRHLALYLGQWAMRGYGVWAVELRAERRLIGSVGVLHPEGWPGMELSWLLARDAWGQGYAREAALAARSFSRDALGVGELISLIRPDNTRSLRLAETLGAVNTGPIEFMGASALRYLHPAAAPVAGRLGG